MSTENNGRFVFRVPSGMRRISKKKQILDKLKLADLPKSYSLNTTKEETILEYVEDFRRQFVVLFPQRRPLLLCPQNECGVRKFVCTSIRPALLPYNDVYGLKECANFVADFLEYIPLDEPTKLPELLASPSTTVKVRTGDCLDFSVLLCSLLRGCGYNAFVVSGYAPKWICEQDQTRSECPLLWDTEEKQEEVEDERTEEEKQKYKVKQRPTHQSQYLKMLEDKKAEEQRKKKIHKKDILKFVSDAQTDPLHGDRVHCWVLVKPGRRDIARCVFVEPTTGFIYPVDKSPYTGIESVFNEHNYWTNVQSTRPQGMDFDLSNDTMWEYVLIDDRQIENKDSMGRDFESVNVIDNDKELTPEEMNDDNDILDAPISWTEKVRIPRDAFKSRYPNGYKKIKYKKCVVEKYSEYNEDVQGLTLKLQVYWDDRCTKLIQIRETFKHRTDSLIQRVTDPFISLNNGFRRPEKVHEVYAPGRAGGLKDYITIGADQREFTFYPNARVDGMVKRQEQIGEKVVELYENRDDFLIYRSVAVDPQIDVKLNKGYTITMGTQTDLPLRKITEKYARNTKKHPEEDVRKRTHFIADELIRLDFHYGKNYITSSRHLIDKHDRDKDATELDTDEKVPQVSRGEEHRVDPTWKPPTKGEQKQYLDKLSLDEKELMAEVKDRETRISELVEQLNQDKAEVKLDKTIYDQAYQQSLQEQQEQKEAQDRTTESNTVDYLSPFLAQYPAGKPLSYRQAMQAKEDCLTALKERLLERANIIQQHLEDENNELHQRQAMYKRQQGAGPGTAVEAEEEFTQYYEQAKFRIDILRVRLARHEELACEKYVTLDNALNNDERLKVLRTQKIQHNG